MTQDWERQRKAFELDAETLVAYRTDVIAEIENQLRAARNTIRLIQKLRGVEHRVGRELTNRQRHQTLDTLSDEWTAIESELVTQHQSCAEIQKTITQMHDRLDGLRKHTSSIRPSPSTRRSGSDQPEG